ncbi:MAG: peptidoglycan-binding domain-containing protein [Patescibacteria group bacterium]
MVKILTKSFIGTVVLAALAIATALPAQAATTDFIADGNITVSSVVYGSLTVDMLIMSGSRAESWNFDSSNFTVTNADATNPFTVGSSDATVKSMRVRQSGGSSETCANNTTLGTSFVTVPTQGSYVVYPSPDLCSVASTGGGGGSKKEKDKPVTSAIPATPGVSSATPASPALANASANASFNRALVAGSTGEDVKRLQQFLNSQGATVASAGPGSAGLETMFFGPATKAAVVKFQLANGVIQAATDLGAGRVGPLTMAKINALLGASATVSAAPLSIAEQIKALTAQLALLQAQLAANQGN